MQIRPGDISEVLGRIYAYSIVLAIEATNDGVNVKFCWLNLINLPHTMQTYRYLEYIVFIGSISTNSSWFQHDIKQKAAKANIVPAIIQNRRLQINVFQYKPIFARYKIKLFFLALSKSVDRSLHFLMRVLFLLLCWRWNKYPVFVIPSSITHFWIASIEIVLATRGIYTLLTERLCVNKYLEFSKLSKADTLLRLFVLVILYDLQTANIDFCSLGCQLMVGNFSILAP